MKEFWPYVSRRRQYAFVGKVVALGLILFGLMYDFLGKYLPVEFWQVAVVFLCASLVLNLLRFFTVSSYRRRSKLPVGEHDNFVLGIDALSALVLFLITTASSFVIFKIAFQAFLTSISLVAVALVLIFRDYISNYLDSFRLMFTADYQIGNYIRVNEVTKGIITDITFRATKLKTDEGDVVYIPNTKLMTSEVVNYSKTKFKRITVPFSLPAIALNDLAAFETKLRIAMVAAFPELIEEKRVFLRVLNIHNWQTEVQLEVSVDHYNFRIEEEITKAVYTHVLSLPSTHSTPAPVIIDEPRL